MINDELKPSSDQFLSFSFVLFCFEIRKRKTKMHFNSDKIGCQEMPQIYQLISFATSQNTLYRLLDGYRNDRLKVFKHIINQPQLTVTEKINEKYQNVVFVTLNLIYNILCWLFAVGKMQFCVRICWLFAFAANENDVNYWFCINLETFVMHNFILFFSCIRSDFGALYSPEKLSEWTTIYPLVVVLRLRFTLRC